MNEQSRRLVYRLIIAVALAMACGRILSAQLVLEPVLHRDEGEPKGKRLWPKKPPKAMPTFGSNDRSRWATIRALVHEGTYAVGQRDAKVVIASAATPLGLMDPWQVTVATFGAHQLRTGPKANTGIIFEDGWGSVDKVLDPTTLKFYSSKPPFLATLVAGLYWLLNTWFGWTLQNHPGAVVRTTLMLLNGGAYWLYLHWLAGLVERYGRTDSGRFFVLAAGAFGTMMTPFLITLNNHVLAAVCVLGATVCGLRIWEAFSREPAASVGPALAGSSRLNGVWGCFFGAGALAAFAVTNEMPALAFAGALFFVLLYLSPRWTLLAFLPPALLVAGAYFFTNYLAVGTWRPIQSEFGGPWYYYEGSHFRVPIEGEQPPGIDFARYRESRVEYAFHLLLGHHGWFSLTPLWLLVVLLLAFRARLSLPPLLAPLILAVSLVVSVFYLLKTDNYGGWTNGPRWLMWLTPLWLIALLPAADWFSERRWGRWLACVLLGFSMLSTHYSLWNPWRHPWIYDLMVSCGWEGYESVKK